MTANNEFISSGGQASNLVLFEKPRQRERMYPNSQKYGNINKEQSHNEIQAGMKQVSATAGGGGGMSDLERRVENLERDVKSVKDDLKEKATKQDLSLLESHLKLEIAKQTSELKDSLPNEDRIKVIFTEQVKQQDIATAKSVSDAVKGSELKIQKLLIGLLIAVVVSLVVQFILRFYEPSKANIAPAQSTVPASTPVGAVQNNGNAP